MTDLTPDFGNISSPNALAESLAARLIQTGRDLEAALANPLIVSVPKQFAHLPRDINNPPFWDVPANIANAPWNMSDERLLAEGPERFTITERINGVVSNFYEVIKTADGYVGLPKNGAEGPGIMGVGYNEKGEPTPVTEGADFAGFAKIGKRLKLLLGQRKPLSGEDIFVFTMLGGFVGKGETPRYSQMREFFEEAVSRSFEIEEDLKQAFDEREDHPENLQAIADKYDLDVSIFNEPAMPEFKFEILKHRDSEFITKLSNLLEESLSSSYEALAKGAGRACSRQIFVHIYAGLFDMDALDRLLKEHNLALDGSDEIGKPELYDLADIDSQRMFGSQGLFLLFSLATVLTKNPELAAEPEIVAQIEQYIKSAEAHLDATNERIMAKQQLVAPVAKPA
ncbi:MAG: hypothetical protein GC136_09260 [Alphaproteobacteria bacterium]|nr:hypothetical protein [Alphaproteobacteria bacterium]